MKKLKNIVFVLGAVAYIITVSGFISNTEKTRRISSVNIRIVDSSKNQFIKTHDIEKILETNNFNPIGNGLSGLNLEKVEKTLKSRQIVKDAEIFITEPGTVQVEISQKTPFVRIFNRTGQGYYLDRKGNIIPLGTGFSPFVIVASGYISEPFSVARTMNIMDVKHDSISRSLHTIYDVYRLADYITRDDFWNSQFEQIYVNSKLEFELIPRVGSHIIEIGRVEGLEEKFENLRILYLKGLNNLGWNQYEKISLKYKNQVVCTKNQLK
jgi:cell division protein FtsQ